MNLLALAAAEAAQDPPLIDLDNTVFLQLALFVISALALSRFLFKPYLAMRAAREEGIEGARDAARRMDEEARAKIADYETRLARARVGANEERLKLRAEAAQREHEITDAARAKTHAAVDEARRKLDTEARDARKALEPRIAEIARAAAKKVLGREVA